MPACGMEDAGEMLPVLFYAAILRFLCSTGLPQFLECTPELSRAIPISK